jgi:hypothetical protein
LVGVGVLVGVNVGVNVGVGVLVGVFVGVLVGVGVNVGVGVLVGVFVGVNVGVCNADWEPLEAVWSPTGQLTEPLVQRSCHVNVASSVNGFGSFAATL